MRLTEYGEGEGEGRSDFQLVLALKTCLEAGLPKKFFYFTAELSSTKKKAPKGTSLDLNSLSSVLMCIHENPNLPYSTVAWFLLFPASLIVLLQLFSTPHLPFDGYS